MDAGREMGPGWIAVAAPAIADDADLAFWVGAALQHNRAVTGGMTSRPPSEQTGPP